MFEERLLELLRWLADHPGQWPSSRGDTPAERRIGKWVEQLFLEGLAGDLPKQRVTAMRRVPRWRWMETLEQLRRWRAQHRDRWPSGSAATKAERRLGAWLRYQRKLAAEGSLSPDRRKALDAGLPGWDEGDRARIWTARFDELEEWRAAHPRSWPQRTATDPHERVLGAWLAYQRSRHRRGTLSRDRAETLASLAGFEWNEPGKSWDERFDELSAWLTAHNGRWPRLDTVSRARRDAERRTGGWLDTIPISEGPKNPEEERLARWVLRQTSDYRAGRLSRARITRLQRLPGWSWERRARGTGTTPINAPGRSGGSAAAAKPARRAV